MSIFGSLTTGISGLQAQSAALGHISDNIANSQTTGYKRVDTAFTNLVLQSNSRVHNPGGVVARPSYANSVSGNITTVDRSTNLAVRGQGFFSVSRLTTANGVSVASSERFYTRDGSFELDNQRILTNRAGYALNGYIYNQANNSYSTTVSPIQVTADIDSPVATRTIELRANLPKNPTAGQPIQPTTISIFDATGTKHDITIGWRPGQTDGAWRMTIDAPGAIGSLPLSGTLPGFPVSAQSTSLTPGREPRKQIEDVEFTTVTGAGIKIGDVYRVTLNGVEFSETVTTTNAGQLANIAGVAQSLADKINGSVPPVGVTAAVTNGKLRLTATNAGSSFTVNTGVTNGTQTTNAVGTATTTPSTATTVAQSVFAFSGTSVDIGDVFQIYVPTPANGGAVGTPPATFPAPTPTPGLYSVTVTASNIGQIGNLNGVIDALVARVNANSSSGNVIASRSGNTLVLRGTNVDEDFTPVAGIGNSTTADTTTFVSAVQGNVTGNRQTQRLSISGVPGDVGADYSVTIRSPSPIQATSIVASGTPAGTVQTFDFGAPAAPSLGSRYAMTVNGTTYSLLINEQNIGDFQNNATDGSVITDLVNKVNNDFGAPFTAVATGGPPATGIVVTAKDTTAVLDVTQAILPSFNQTITYTTTGQEVSLEEIAANLAAKVNQTAGIPVQAASIGGVITLTANQENVAFFGEPMATAGNTPPHIGLTFGGSTKAGTLSSLSSANIGDGNATVSAVNEDGSPAQITFNVDYGDGPQTITLDLGNFGTGSGLTEYEGSAINVISQLQDGSAQGTFRDVEIRENGDVIANYDNGNKRVIAKVPLVLFNDPNSLNRETGGVFTESSDSGRARFTDTGLNGAGTIAVSSLEGSNVDIAQEFTKLIVAQRSYTANTRVITTTDEMLTETINLKR